MSGTQIFVVVLILVIGMLILLLLALRSRTPATAEFAVEKAFSFKISLSPADKDKAADAVADAATARGQSGADAADDIRLRLAAVQDVPLRRVLWVDDHPDFNIYESLALMRLGFVITTATSNDAARRFVAEAYFDLVITDLGRDGTQDDGRRLVEELHATAPALPVVVYTVRADQQREKLVAAGASAVEDRPAALIGAVLSNAP